MNLVAEGELTPIKITLTDDEASALEAIAEKRRKERRTKQIGKGTIASEIVARVIAEHPELMRQWFGEEGMFLEPEKENEDKRPKARKRASGE